jgi:transposase
MRTVKLTNEQWEKMLPFLRSCEQVYVGDEAECRRFLEAVLWITRSGAQWRLLPNAYGNWNTIYKRFARWSERAIFTQLHQHFVDEPDLQDLILDSTIVRAHPAAAGAQKKAAGKRPKP